MKGVETSGAVILKTRAFRELQLQIGKAGLAFVKNGSPEEGVALDVQYDFRQTLCCGEEVVRLKTRYARDGEKRVCLRQCDHIVWNRINAKFARIEVLHHILIAKLRDVRDAVYVIGKVCPIFQAETVSLGRNLLPRYVRLIYIRVLVINKKGFYPRLTVLVLPIINNGIEADGRPATAKVIEANAPLDVVRNRKGYFSEQRWSPGARVCWRDSETERVTE